MHYKKGIAVILSAVMMAQVCIPAAAAETGETVTETVREIEEENTDEGIEGETDGQPEPDVAEEGMTEAAPEEDLAEDAENTAEPPADTDTEDVQEKDGAVEDADEGAAEPNEEDVVEDEAVVTEDGDAPAEMSAEKDGEQAEGKQADQEQAPSEEDAGKETDGAENEEYEEIDIQTDDIYTDTDAFSDFMTEEEMAAGYIDSIMYPGRRTLNARRANAGARLTGVNRGVYNVLNRESALVAEGERTSTAFEVRVEEFGIEKTAWTAEELGVDAIVVNGSIPSEVVKKVQRKLNFDFELMLSALLADNPYTLYWFDKTGNCRAGGFSLSTSRNSDGQIQIGVKGSITIYMPVVSAYAESEYEMRADVGTSIQTAKDTADSIVSAYNGSTDYQKLVAYKKEICDLTDYNYDAVNTATAYGDPWQLVWVFDEDPDTKVVCEGYSKAYKYLCDLTSFDSDDIGCILAMGTMSRGSGSGSLHMWNIVTVPGGRNYLADITNSDSGTAGSGGYLFLAGPAEDDDTGSPEDGYKIPLSYGYMNYTYMEDMFAMYDSEDIELANGRWDGKLPEDIAGTDISIGQKSFTYTGEKIEPEILVKDGAETLQKNTDYAVTYDNNINAGTASYTVTGMGNYTGTASGTFTILPYAPTENEITVDFGTESITYDGKEKKPEAGVSVGGKTLTAGTDYDVSYSNNVNAGNASVTVTGKGNYAFEKASSFTIAPSQDFTASLVSDTDVFEYTGAEICPEVKVMSGNTVLVQGKDYEISYENNTDQGQASITVAGKGNYTGSKALTFTINKKTDIADAEVSLDSVIVYDGKEKEPVQEITVNGKILDEDTDYKISYKDNINAGTASYTVTGKGDYTGTAEGTFTILPSSEFTVSLLPNNDLFEYTGEEICPEIKVVSGSRTLVLGKDYDISFSDNTNPGQASVTATGRGNYTGSRKLAFTITEKTISGAAVSLNTPVVFDGGAKTPVRQVTVDDKTLSEGSDYTVSYTDNVNTGIASYTITGKGVYTGTIGGTFTIMPYAPAEGDIVVTVEEASYIYDGTEKKPEVTVSVDGRELIAGTDYTVTYSGNINAGTASVSVAGRGNYAFGKNTVFTIEPSSDFTASFVSDEDSYEYTGSAVRPEVKAMSGSVVLTDGKDYTLSYKNNVDPGNASVAITGKGNYIGSKTLAFTITEKAVPPEKTNIADAEIILDDQVVYDGKEKRPVKGVTAGGKTLREGIDYTVAYSDNVDAGTAKAVVSGTGDCEGTKTVTFTIGKKTVTPQVKLSESVFTYDGKAHKPQVIVTCDGKTASADDYDTAYNTDCVNAGTCKVTVTMKGNYTGSASSSYRITKKVITPKVSLSSTSLVYNGRVQKPSVKVYDGTELLRTDDYNIIWEKESRDAGAYKASVTMKGNYAGKTEFHYAVTAKKVSPEVILSAKHFTYDGKAHKPSVTVKCSGTVVPSSAYTLTFSGSGTDAGTYTVTATMKGNYNGRGTADYKVLPKKIRPSVSLSAVKYTYSGKVRTPSVIVKDGNIKLPASAYTITYAKGRKNPGTYRVTVNMRGNYTGTGTGSFTIIPKKTKIVKLTPYSGKIKVSWEKQVSGITGYRIQYAENKKFTKSRTITVNGSHKTSVMTGKLEKGKRYYVRIQTFKTVGGRSFRSGWSAAKNIKITK